MRNEDGLLRRHRTLTLAEPNLQISDMTLLAIDMQYGDAHRDESIKSGGNCATG